MAEEQRVECIKEINCKGSYLGKARTVHVGDIYILGNKDFTGANVMSLDYSHGLALSPKLFKEHFKMV